ncbi:DUF4286 family protein [Terrimonas pollutisoli]|uniref:DUF4286 family protein n=1 Tax=Terrimonas pollutisoli TaxID=3034147 RepID=UPI0023EDD781|nr:DUF4286 family protein [Terrimonas sp. H1YJ31]
MVPYKRYEEIKVEIACNGGGDNNSGNQNILAKRVGMETSGSIIYNVTTKVDHRIASQWLQWIKEEHIPGIIATGCFTHATVLRLMEVDETEGLTYAIQYHAVSKAFYNRYIQNFAGEMRTKATTKWGDAFIAFNSVLEVVN